MTTFVDKDIVIYSVTYAKVNGGTKSTRVSIFTGKCDYWATSKRDLRESNLARDTSIESKDVTIDGVVNNIVIGDNAELFDINGTSIGFFVVYEIDKFNSPKGRATNTFMRVSKLDG